MDIKAFIKNANEEYVKIKNDIEKERATLNEALEQAQKALNGERERFKKEEEELLGILDATKKERIGEIERVAIEKMDILKAEKEKIIREEASRRQNVENAYKERFESLEREHSDRLEEKKRRYEKRKELANREFEELRLNLESSSAVHGDMEAMLANRQNRELLEKIDEIEDRNVTLRASIHQELEEYSEKLIEYLKLRDFTFEPPSKKDLLERAKSYYDSLDELNSLQSKLQKAQGCDALVEYNRVKLDEAKKELEKNLNEIDEWYVAELEGENRNYISEKNILERQKGNSDVEKPELVERIEQIDKELKEIEDALVIESGKIMEDLSRSEGAKTRMFNMVKADELRKQQELLSQAREKLEGFVKSQDKRLEDFLNKVKRELQDLVGGGRDFSVGQIRDGKVRSTLPKTITIGGCGTTLAECELLERLYGKGSLELPATISIDVLSGEPLIFTSDNDEYLDRIMGGITLKFLEEFPQGSLGVRIISDKREIFESVSQGIDKSGSVMSKDPVPALFYADAEANRITGKLSGEIKTAYDLYEREKGQVATLVVIRDGIDEILNDGEMTSILRKLLSERGIKAGVRLIIACSDPQALNGLYESAVSISIKGEDVLFDGEKINICSIPNKDISFFIKGVFSDMASLVEGNVGRDIPCASYYVGSDKEDEIEDKIEKNEANKSYSIDRRITYEDLGFEGPPEKMEEEIELPVGLMENGVASICFDCGASKGQNTGCIVVGATSTGKSSLLHSLVVEGCKKYSPKDLELWLLDFKKEGAVDRYLNAKIPHIKVLKQWAHECDIYYILNSLCGEIENRINCFKTTGIGLREKEFENVFEYNQFVEKNKCYGTPFPRIVLVIDEIQELFWHKENNLIADIMARLATVTVRGRCAGIHTVIIANDIGPEAYALRDAYINHIKCKVSFRLSQSSLTESQLGKDFEQRAEQICSLSPGEMYISTGESVAKAKTPYVNSELLEEYFVKIRKEYEGLDLTDCEKERCIKPVWQNGSVQFVVGENDYTGKPAYVSLDKSSSSLVVVSKSEDVQSRILSSILIGASELEGARALCCNGGSIFETLFYSTLKERAGLSVREYEKTDFTELVKDGYSELVSRRNSPQRNESPLFIIVNGLSRLSLTDGKISNNEGPKFASAFDSSKREKDASISDIFEMLEGNEPRRVGFVPKQAQDFNISVREAYQALITEGGPLGIFVISSLDNTKNYESLISKCHITIASPDVLNDSNLEECGKGGLVPFLSKIKDEEDARTIIASGNSVDKIRPIIFG
ncbi:MAG: hypothetical protein IJ400_05295 [Clostridia bacterium]|nr:hypothetical protein [Clostridia bacterium]